MPRFVHSCSFRSTFSITFSALVLSLACSATTAQESMQYPIDVVTTADGTMYVADRKLPGIWKVENGETSIFFQAEKRFGTTLNAIRCLAIDHEGKLLAGDSATFGVYRFDDSGAPEKIHDGRIGVPMGIAVTSDGTVFVSDSELHRIFKVAPGDGDAKPQAEIVAGLNGPRGMCVDDEDRVWVISAREGQVRRIAADGSSMETIVDGLPFQFPAGIAFHDGSAYVVDSFADTVYRVTEGSAPEPFSQGEPFVHPVGISVHDGGLFVADSRANAIFQLGEDGTATTVVSGSANESP